MRQRKTSSIRIIPCKGNYEYYIFGDYSFPAYSYNGGIPMFWNDKRWVRYSEDFSHFAWWASPITEKEFVNECKRNNCKGTALRNAFRIACRLHDGQFRKDGVTPYIRHPMKVAALLKKWGVKDEMTFCAAYLHDVIEDCQNVNEDEIIECCTKTTLDIVKILSRGKNEPKDDYIRRVIDSNDIRALIIKAADRICNTLDFMHDGKEDYAKRYFHKADGVFEKLKTMTEYRQQIENCLNDAEILASRL